MRNIKLIVEYNGAAYSGWQFQPKQKTLQNEIEQAIRKLTGQKTTLYAAGRTDAGVHALGQVANFKTDHTLPVKKFRDGLNYYLPDDLRIQEAEEVSLDFHARYDAVYRHYRYCIGRTVKALSQNRQWVVTQQVNRDKLDTCAAIIKGDHDFSTFCVVSSQRDNNRCLVYRSVWRQQGPDLIYDIIADRFLHTMIRSLVGLMLEVGRGRTGIRQFREIFESGDHTAIKKVAPARGLTLIAVGY